MNVLADLIAHARAAARPFPATPTLADVVNTVAAS
jgi:hypothetical protein